MKRSYGWVAFALVAALAAGCSQRKERGMAETRGEGGPTDVRSAIADEVHAALEAGNTNGAIERLQRALADEEYANETPWLFPNILGLMLMAGRVDEAREAMLGALRDGAPYAQNGFGAVYRHYVENGDAADRLEWTGRLLDAGLTGPMKTHAFGWRLNAVRDVEGMDGAVALAPVCASEFSAEEARPMLSGFIENVLAAGDTEGASRFLDALSAAADHAPDIGSFVDVSRVDVLLAEERWEDADGHLRAAAGRMRDDDLLRGLRRFAEQTGKKGEGSRAERLGEFVIDRVADKPLARDAAVAIWMAAARKTGDARVTVERLGRIVEMELPFAVAAGQYRASFYDVLNANNADATARLLDIGDTLSSRLGEVEDDQGIRMLQLDGVFLTEDYDRAIALLEKGVPGRDDAWVDMAVNKIKAHKAVREGRPEEAVERFRVFMAGVEKWENAEQDPATGAMHTREMTLGRNAMRIGGIYASMGKDKEASAAYEEASDYYTRALMTVEPESKEYEILKSEMARIPSDK